jgi:hypothetical protein
MPPKRASVPTNTFGASSSALDKLTGRNSPAEPDLPPATLGASLPSADSSNTVITQNGNTVSMQQRADDESADDSRTREKITFYLRPDQVEKLDELVIAYKRQTGQRMNRNALMRLLLDRVDIALLLQDKNL